MEFDEQGKEVWAYETDKRIRDAQRLPNGNTLVVELRGRVIEVTPDKRVVWQAPDEMDDVVSAVRLEDGTTRVVSSTGMYEVDSFGLVQKVIDYRFGATPNGGCFY